MSEPLFKYKVRVSPMARTVRLRVTLQQGLEVVIPKGYDESKIPGLLERKKHWVRAALDRAESHRKFFEPEPIWRLPMQIKLPAIGAVWHVTSKQTDVKWVAVREIGPERLLIFGAIEDQEACRAALVRWLMRQAHQHLLPRLQSLSLKDRAALQTRTGQATANPMGELLETRHNLIECQVAVPATFGCGLRHNS